MTDQQHPITPPPGLVQQWTRQKHGILAENLATQAAQWGADAELEAILALAGREIPEQDRYFDGFTAASIRHDRRPKPPSLKESALNALEHILRHSQTNHGANTIRRALEQLND